MEHRRSGPRGDLGRAANIARRNHVGGQLGDVGDLAVPELRGDHGLKDIIGPRRATAQVRLRRLPDLIARR